MGEVVSLEHRRCYVTAQALAHRLVAILGEVEAEELDEVVGWFESKTERGLLHMALGRALCERYAPADVVAQMESMVRERTA